MRSGETVCLARTAKGSHVTLCGGCEDEDVIQNGGAVLRNDDPTKKVEKFAEQIGWSNYRVDIFTQLVAAYKNNPTIENYLHIRIRPLVGEDSAHDRPA